MTSRRGSDGVGSVGAAKKVLVNVTVERSLGRVQVVTSPDTRLEDLIKAVIEIYVKEKMRPLLTQTHPHHFDLHYSQFTFECLDPNKELKDAGSRNFFLCMKTKPIDQSSNNVVKCPDELGKEKNLSKWPSTLTKFMDFLL
ncbi:hypothetical protein Syun_013091 [Stephania yunnanensis]|uniref:DUF7054 domain-containing protein n=1 Tax=Stephania yunnanensis TaxID=152371 RepID=A0AAP0K0R1_9MAGN